MHIVLNKQLPADLTMTDTHLMYLADQINDIFTYPEVNKGSTIFVLKRCANKEQMVDNYKVVYEDKFGSTVLAEWANAESTHTTLLATHNFILAYGI